MEFVLQAVIVVFMLFLCLVCLFSVVVIVRDIISENSKRKEMLEPAPTPAQPAPQPVIIQMQQPEPVVVQAQPQPAPVVEEAKPVASEEVQPAVQQAPVIEEVATTAVEIEDEEDPNSVAFSRTTLTMEEKYATLSTEHKRFFDDIVNHALEKTGVKENRKPNAYDYKIGANRVIKLTIKRGEIVCEFNFIDNDFDQYASTSNVKIKRAGTVVRITEPSAVGVAKDGIDLVCEQIEELKRRKKELANEKRRERRKASKSENEGE